MFNGITYPTKDSTKIAKVPISLSTTSGGIMLTNHYTTHLTTVKRILSNISLLAPQLKMCCHNHLVLVALCAVVPRPLSVCVCCVCVTSLLQRLRVDIMDADHASVFQEFIITINYILSIYYKYC